MTRRYEPPLIESGPLVAPTSYIKLVSRENGVHFFWTFRADDGPDAYRAWKAAEAAQKLCGGTISFWELPAMDGAWRFEPEIGRLYGRPGRRVAA